MISFGFRGRTYLAVSIEARRKKGESYSTPYLYELGRLDSSRPFAELERICR
jgi:hypothetical protein